jgi:hypothetical protein
MYLFSFLLCKFGERIRAQETFVGVLSKMGEMDNIHELFMQYVRTLDRTVMDPLFLEFIDA